MVNFLIGFGVAIGIIVILIYIFFDRLGGK